MAKKEEEPDVPWNLMGIAGSLGGFALGCALLADDYKDFGDFSTPNHPNPLHHWQLAIPILLGSLAGLGLSLLNLLYSAPPPPIKEAPPPVQETPPESFLEQAAPLNEVQKRLRIA